MMVAITGAHVTLVALFESDTTRLATVTGAFNRVTPPLGATHCTLPPHLRIHSLAPNDPDTTELPPLFILSPRAVAYCCSDDANTLLLRAAMVVVALEERVMLPPPLLLLTPRAVA